MGDMVFSPLFDDLDSEREVVLEEIAMYEDTPQELVHDLIGEAVFGSHALGRPVIGTAEVISRVSARAARPPSAFYTPSNVVVAAAGSIDHDELVDAGPALDRARDGIRPGSRGSASRSSRPRSRACASSARTPSSTTSASAPPASRAPTGAASPPRSSTRSSAARPPRGCSRRSARSGGWLTPSTASSRSTPTPGRSASTSARARRTSPRRSRSPWSRSPTSPPGTCGRAS